MMQYLKVTITIFIISLGVMAIVFYRASARHTIRTDFQIVQQTETEDFYSMFKGSEYIAEATGEMVGSEEFMNKIIKKDNDLEKRIIAGSLQKKIEKWNKMVYVDDVTVHGKFSLYVKSNDIKFAKTLSLKIADTIINDNDMYQGEKNKKRKIVIVKNQDGEIIEQYEEDDGNYGAHISIRTISEPIIMAGNSLSFAIIAGLVSFFGILFLGYLKKISESL